MKAKLYVCIILTALIAVFTISGCNKAPEAELAATLDEATVDEVVISSTAIIETTAITTVAPTETTVGETTTKAEETTEAIEVNQTSYDDNNNNNASANTQKPNNTSNSNNVSGNTTNNTSTNKSGICFDKEQITVEIMATERLEIKSQDGGCHIETDNNNVNVSLEGYTLIVEGRCSGSCVITATSPTTGETATCNVTILKRDTSGFTDDTPLVFDEMNTEEMMQRMVDDCIEYFTSLGMTYNEELDPSWAGWYYGHQGGLSYTDVRSYNETSERNIIGIKEQVDAVLIDYYGCEYTDITFKPCYELTDRETYSIIFCYG
ncbi:MAG: hypothetical protein IJF19_01185 [Clostridia bacterium]|nr:hypothetical protein [Clostridia bacterium]